MDWSQNIQTLLGLTAVVNPFGAIPVYLALTERSPRSQQRRIVATTALALAAVLVCALLAGNALMHFFGIGIPTFRVAGGILIFMVALSMMRGGLPPGANQDDDPSAIGVVPLAIPLLGGPGAFSTVVVLSRQYTGIADWLWILASIVLVTAITYGALRLAPVFQWILGGTGLKVITRLMGLVLAALALEFIAAGLTALFPGLAGS